MFAEARYPSSLVGLTREQTEVQAYYLEQAKQNYNLDWKYQDEETSEMLRLRAKEALAYIAAQKEDSIAVVTHGRFLRYILLHVAIGDFLNREQEEHLMKSVRVSNTGITVFQFSEEDGWKLLTWNDHAHLG